MNNNTNRGRSRRRKKKTAGRFVLIGLQVVFGMLFVFGAVITVDILAERASAQDAYEDLRESLQTRSSTDETAPGITQANETQRNTEATDTDVTTETAKETEPQPAVSMDFTKLQEINQEIVA